MIIKNVPKLFGTLKELLAGRPTTNPNTKIYVGVGWIRFCYFLNI